MPERRAWPQDHSVAIVMEGTGDDKWGTAPIGHALQIPVEPGSWLNDNVAEFRDENIRSMPVKDFNSSAVVSSGEGRLMGNFYPIISPYILAGMMGREAVDAKANATNVAIPIKKGGASATDSDFFAHEFHVGEVPRSFAIQQSVTANAIDASGASTGNDAKKQLFLGMYPSTYTLKYDAGEGAVTWECDFIGKGLVYPGTPKTEVGFTTTSGTALGSLTGDRVPRPLLGPECRVALKKATGGLMAYGYAMDLELMFSREITLDYSAGGHAGGVSGYRPTILGVEPLRVTFVMTCDLVSANEDEATSLQAKMASIRSYSKALGGTPAGAGSATHNSMTSATRHADGDADTHFGSKQNQFEWLFRFATPKSITATSKPDPTTSAFSSTASTDGTTVVTSGADNTEIGDKLSDSTYYDTADDAVMDILLKKVSFGDGPVEVDRSGNTTTFQFKGVAVFDKADTPGTGVVTTRLYNKKNNRYLIDPTVTGYGTSINALVRNSPTAGLN